MWDAKSPEGQDMVRTDFRKYADLVRVGGIPLSALELHVASEVFDMPIFIVEGLLPTGGQALNAFVVGKRRKGSASLHCL